jgi:hypothetical protein
LTTHVLSHLSHIFCSRLRPLIVAKLSKKEALANIRALRKRKIIDAKILKSDDENWDDDDEEEKEEEEDTNVVEKREQLLNAIGDTIPFATDSDDDFEQDVDFGVATPLYLDQDILQKQQQEQRQKAKQQQIYETPSSTTTSSSKIIESSLRLSNHSPITIVPATQSDNTPIHHQPKKNHRQRSNEEHIEQQQHLQPTIDSNSEQLSSIVLVPATPDQQPTPHRWHSINDNNDPIVDVPSQLMQSTLNDDIEECTSESQTPQQQQPSSQQQYSNEIRELRSTMLQCRHCARRWLTRDEPHLRAHEIRCSQQTATTTPTIKLEPPPTQPLCNATPHNDNNSIDMFAIATTSQSQLPCASSETIRPRSGNKTLLLRTSSRYSDNNDNDDNHQYDDDDDDDDEPPRDVLSQTLTSDSEE